MKAYGRDWWASGAWTCKPVGSLHERFPSGRSISGPVWESFWHRLITAIAGH